MNRIVTMMTLLLFAFTAGYAATHATPQSPHHHKKIKPKKLKKVFLIKKGLPHYSKIIKKHWNDPRLNLTDTQKKELLALRQETMGKLKALYPKVKKLRKQIVKAGRKGESLSETEKMVDELARLKAEATKIHLLCIAKTRKILTPKQWQTLQSKKKKKKHKKKK